MGKCGVFPHIQAYSNSLEHWIAFKYIINSEMVEVEAADCTIHHIACFKLPAFCFKIYLSCV
jgi:hypothetical protein